MRWRDAWLQMLYGRKVKLPSWSGYWAWEDGTIMIHCKDGRVLDLFDTEDKAMTLSNMASEDWMVVSEGGAT